MIGKAEWFGRRKYTGWGLTPKTWQGWAYIAAFIVPLAVFQALPFWDAQTRILATGVWMAVLLLDVFHIMATMKKDERETKIEALSERNAAWAMIAAIMVGILYQTWSSVPQKEPQIDGFLIAALVAGLVAKALSNIYLERKPL